MAAKSKARRAFARKLARLANALERLRNDASCYGLVGEAREVCQRDEQVGAVMLAMDALSRASGQMASAVRELDDSRQLTYDDDPPARTEEQPLALAKYVAGVGYVLNGRIVG